MNQNYLQFNNHPLGGQQQNEHALHQDQPSSNDGQHITQLKVHQQPQLFYGQNNSQFNTQYAPFDNRYSNQSSFLHQFPQQKQFGQQDQFINSQLDYQQSPSSNELANNPIQGNYVPTHQTKNNLQNDDHYNSHDRSFHNQYDNHDAYFKNQFGSQGCSIQNQFGSQSCSIQSQFGSQGFSIQSQYKHQVQQPFQKQPFVQPRQLYDYQLHQIPDQFANNPVQRNYMTSNKSLLIVF